jgi:hypothetical protein
MENYNGIVLQRKHGFTTFLIIASEEAYSLESMKERLKYLLENQSSLEKNKYEFADMHNTQLVHIVDYDWRKVNEFDS